MGKTEDTGDDPVAGQEPLDELSTALDQLDLQIDTKKDAWNDSGKGTDDESDSDNEEKLDPCTDSTTGTSPVKPVSALTTEHKAPGSAAPDAAAADGEQSDEDNEAAIADVVEKVATLVVSEKDHSRSSGAVKKILPAHPPSKEEEDDEDYQERGPCKVSRSNYSSARYNPMEDSAYDSPPHGGSGAGAGAGYDTPQYSSPAYSLTPSYSVDYSTDWASPQQSYDRSPDYQYSPGDYQLPQRQQQQPQQDGLESSSPSVSSHAFDYNADMLAAVAQQFNSSLLSPNYLDALEDAVAKSVSGEDLLSSSSSGDEDRSDSGPCSVRLIIDGLRSIDPTELDYISPASPGPAYHDLEQELALSADPWADCTLSPSPPESPGSPPSLYSPSQDEKVVEGHRSAVTAVRELCNNDVILQAARRVACQRSEDLCCKDPDGDTCYMIVVCKPSSSPNFYENLFVLQQHLQHVLVCCDAPIDSESNACPRCGSGPQAWRTPLSETNNAGDSVLSCACKMRHPEVVINYLCAGLAECSEDLRRVFQGPGRDILAPYATFYPVLKRFL